MNGVTPDPIAPGGRNRDEEQQAHFGSIREFARKYLAISKAAEFLLASQFAVADAPGFSCFHPICSVKTDVRFHSAAPFQCIDSFFGTCVW